MRFARSAEARVPVTRATAALLLSVALGTAPPLRTLGAQTPAAGVIEGRVTDVSNGRALEAAQISVIGTTLGAATNATGAFRVTGVPARAVQIRVRLIGYQPAERSVTVVAGQSAHVDVTLQASALQLEQVVVTGTGGAVETKKLGNTVAVVKPPENAPVVNVSEVLQGREPGLVGLPSGGMTGEGARIRIRGNASLSQSNEPIILVDGIRINSAGGLGQAGGAGASSSRLDDIDPSTIERVEVLKGAAAATLYGTEASNGVIQIFTKRGSSGAPRWDFGIEQSLSQFPLDRFPTNAGFAKTQGQADSLTVFYGRSIRPFEIIEKNIWKDNIAANGYGQMYSGQVSGGTERIGYFVSGRYEGANGPLGGELAGKRLGPADDIARHTQATSNLNFQPRNNLRLDVNTAYTGTSQQIPSNGNDITGFVSQVYLAKPENANCRQSVVDNPQTASTMGVASPGVCVGAGNPFGNGAFATIREAAQLQREQEVQRFRGSSTAALSVRDNLQWTSTLGIDVTAQRSWSMLPFGNNIDRQNSTAPNGRRTIDDIADRQITVDTKLGWKTAPRSWLESDFTVGVQGFFSRNVESNSTAENFPGPGLEVVGAGTPTNLGETFLSTVTGGFFGQEQFSLFNWIHTTVGGRYDYSSAFGKQAPGVFYPKASISVVPSDRPGWKEHGFSSVISALRLRAALGQSGRQPGAYDQFTTYGPLQLAPSGTGLVPLNLGNDKLAPEVSTEAEVGFELGLFDNRAGVQVTGWNRVVNDLLVPVQYPPSGGFLRTQLTNVGQMKGRGLELSVNGLAVSRPNLQIDLQASGAYLWQRVTDMGGAAPIKVGAGGVRYRNFVAVGYAPGALFGAKLVGACSARPAGANYACMQPNQVPYDFNGDKQPDTMEQALAYFANVPRSGSTVGVAALSPIAVDEDGDGDLLDHFLGKPTPDWTGSFGGNMTLYRKWRLNTLFEFKGGRYTVSDMTDAFMNALTIALNSERTARLDAVLQNPASTAQQRLDAGLDWAYNVKALSPYDGLNQNFSGNFLRWRELGLTYTADNSLARKVGASSLAITGAARNLLLFTKYPGVDPEANQGGRGNGSTFDQNFADAIDVFGLPLQRRFSLAVRLGF
jgi:TonB-linked SusC/RagA family outer membrane protein